MERNRNLEMAVLNRISHAVMRERNVSALLRQVLDILCREMGLVRGTVTLLRGRQLVIEASNGLSREEMRRGRYRLGEGVTGQVALTGEARIIPDISQEPEFLYRTGARERDSHVAFICVPVVHQGKVIGTMSIDREVVEGADLERDYRLLEIVANLMAEAVSLDLAEHEERSRLIAENARLKRALDRISGPPEVIGNCRAMRMVYAMIEQVASSSATVLIRGSSGTGKELVARALQRSGDRCDRPFIVVNSAALPENLIESELFGHEKGAFTGAVQRRIGRIEAADGGTLFLDEIGDLGPAMQVKLLRFLQERTFQRVGSNEEHRSDVRIIAATSRNLERLMEEGRFREDLYYRLNVFPIHLPDLAERKSDIPLLATHFLAKYSRLHHRQVRRISTEAMNRMVDYHWPGNVRELENCIERAVLTAAGEIVDVGALPAPMQGGEERAETPLTGDFTTQVEEFERRLIREALRKSRGNVAAAARELGLTVRILHYTIRKLGVVPREFR